MSLQNSFNKIRRSAGIKKCVMIDGNVGDVYLDENNKIVTLREYLEAMFKDMDYSILYEGVENAGDEERCRGMFASYLQGFKYSRPIPIAQLREFLKREEVAA